MNLCVIPARGGSKRIPRKNIRPFRGKPMIAWSVEAARESEVFDQIIVSTDDPEIADCAKVHGADVPFLRPADLSNDLAGTSEVVAHAVRQIEETGSRPSAVCCVYATAPLVRPVDIRDGLDRLTSGDWAFCFSATTFPSPIFRSFRVTSEGGVEMFFPEHFTTRSQDLPEALHDAAQFYWGRPEAWTSGLRMFDRHSTPLLIPRWRVQDIDTEEDWKRAEMLCEAVAGCGHG